MAHATALLQSVKELPSSSPLEAPNPMHPLNNMGDTIHRSLNGTKLNWNKLATTNFGSVTAKKAKKVN